MSYDEGLAFRMECVFQSEMDIEEKRMFGGVVYMIGGNIACGIFEDFLIVRVGIELYDESLQKEYVQEFDVTGRPMKGWVMVDSCGLQEDRDLEAWMSKGLTFAKTLPQKY